MTVQIPVTQGGFAIVDVLDAAIVRPHRWHRRKDGHIITTFSENGKRVTRDMAHFIIEVPVGLEPDHRNLKPWDNRRSNLRISNRSQNNANRAKYKGVSKYKGVYRTKDRSDWRAQITVNKKPKYLGYFDDEDDAARAYNRAALAAFGEFSRLNTIV